MKIKHYPDKSSYAITEDFGEGVTTFRVNTYNDLWALNQFVDAYINKYKQEPLIKIPNLLDAQADRRFYDNHSSNLKLTMKFLNSIPASFKIFHPHNPEVVEAGMDKVEILDNSRLVKNIITRLSINLREKSKSDAMNGCMEKQSRYDINNRLILMSSDSGGFKTLSKVCDSIGWKGEMYSAAKARSWDEREGTKFVQQIDRTDFQGKDILIVDDICVYGGTFKGIANLLKDKNVGDIYLLVSHMTVQDLGQDPVTNYFKQVFTTNSKYDKYYGHDDFVPKNLHITDIKTLF